MKNAPNVQENSPDQSVEDREGRGTSPVTSSDAGVFVVQSEPWRVLRLYFWLAMAATLGPVLVGLWAGLVGFLLTQHTAGEILERCIDLVGYAPFIGLLVVVLAVPAGAVILRVYRRQAWVVDARGIRILMGDEEQRRMEWDEIDSIRVGINGPLILLKDRHQEGEQLTFVPRDASVRLHRYWAARDPMIR